MQKKLFDISGMTCSACSTRIEKAVAKHHGINDVNVNLLKNNMTVSYDDQIISANAIAQIVNDVGYHAVLHENSQQSNNNENPPDSSMIELQEMKKRLWVSLIFTLPLFYLSMGHMTGLPIPSIFLGEQNALIYIFSQFLLMLPVVVVNSKYYRTGFKTLFAGSPNMDSLIAIGSSAAVISGIYTIFKMSYAIGHHDFATANHASMNVYFESAAMILTLITLGKFFEAQAKGKTSDAIKQLMNLAPKTATVIRDGIESTIPSDELKVDDIVVVKAGESIPVDGVITKGHAFIDESAITGESVPIEKQKGDRVISATLSKSGYFQMQATQVGENTTLSQIVKLVDEATSSKAPIARIADKISGFFVPTVILIAIIATVIWLLLGYDFEFSLSIGIAVLVISCPCALGLATPTAIMVGTGRGAKFGILFKSAEAIETAQAVDTVILDKTGTITEGKPAVTDIVVNENSIQESSKLLQIAASLEKLSEHPLAKAIVNYAELHSISLVKVDDFIQLAGQGISGTIEDKCYFAGNKKLMNEQGITLPETIALQSEKFAGAGKTVLYFANKQHILGIIAVADVIKSTSRQAVAELYALGINVIMLTGDNAKTASAVQQQVGIKQTVSDVLPQDKELHIRQLKEQGRNVAMVGDGINDAPALARANVGIAIGAGTDIAIESADIVLMKNDLLDVVTTIQLSKSVMRNIRQNLFWAFFYNVVGIPIAAGLFYKVWGLTLNPMIAAAAMSLSSVCVVSNALRLRLFKPRHIMPDTENKSSATSNELITIDNRSYSMIKHILVEGMSCNHCAGHVEKALQNVSGVVSVKVDLAAKTAVVEVNNNCSDEALRSAITDAGYDAIEIREV